MMFRLLRLSELPLEIVAKKYAPWRGLKNNALHRLILEAFVIKEIYSGKKWKAHIFCGMIRDRKLRHLKKYGGIIAMLITNGNAMMGTVFDDPGEMAMQLSIGNCLTFGSFMTLVDSFNIPVRLPMLWHVVDKQENRLKLLSYFFFEHTGFVTLKDDSEDATWENSEIRYNLNNKYFRECFSENERNAILTTEVTTKTHDSSLIETKDKLYIPSLNDIENIPEHLKIGRCLCADSYGNDIPAVNLMYCFYWLRDPGEFEDENLVVQGYANSKLVLDSLEHNSGEVGVRALMWVDAKKIK